MLPAQALSRLILVSAVLVTMVLAINHFYLSAAGLGLGVISYVYLALWGDRPIEDQLIQERP